MQNFNSWNVSLQSLNFRMSSWIYVKEEKVFPVDSASI